MTEPVAAPADDPSAPAGSSVPNPGADVAVASGRDRAWWFVAAGAVLVAVVVNVVVAVSARHPSFPFDEVSMLQMSRMIAGFDTPVVRGAGYFPGWAALMAPIWWFTSNPLTMYRVAIWLGVVVAVLTIWPLALLVRRFKVTPAQSVAVAALVMILPTRAIQSDYVLSEKLLFLLAVLAALAAYRVAERTTVVRAVVMSLVLSLLLFTHIRTLPALLAAGVWFALLAVRHWRAGLAGLFSLVVLGELAQWAGKLLNLHLLGHKFDQDGTIQAVLKDLHPGLPATVATGQAWYQSIATFGLIGLGLVVLVQLSWREVRHLRISGASYVLGSTLAVFLISVLQWSSTWWLYRNPWIRLDAWIYGRYNDPFAVLLTVFALAAVIRGSRRWMHAVGAVATLIIYVPMLTWVAPRAPTWGFVTPAHISGVMAYWPWLPTKAWRHPGWVSAFSGRNDFFLIASAVTLVILVAVYALRGRPLQVVTGLVLIAAVASVSANHESNRFQDEQGVIPARVATVRAEIAAHPGTTVGYDSSCDRAGLDAEGQNYWSYWLLPSIVRPFNSARTHPRTTIVLGCHDWPGGERLGARRVTSSNAYATDVWVMPGSLQRSFEQRGLLDPA